MIPKKWIKKYCHKDYVICDGMVNAFNPLELLQSILVIGGVIGLVYFTRQILIKVGDKKK